MLEQKAKSWLRRMRLPASARGVLRQDAEGLREDLGPIRTIAEGIAWLGRAQDRSLSKDGGVARHFSLISGWSHSYPETTGYLIPTMLAVGVETRNDELMQRARRMLDWLAAIQFPEGGFQGGTVNQTPRVPVTFNTGQILMGLAAGSDLDARYRAAMHKAADWLVQTQDEDGCWRKYPTPFAKPGEKTYETHVALGLMDAARIDAGRGYLESALKQVNWALTNQLPNGWLAKCCLEEPGSPLTHTLGYALRGIVGAYLSSKDERYLNAACLTADGLLSAMDSSGRLPGRLDSNWRAAVDWVCLTGTSQIAHCWLLLHRATGRGAYLQAGLTANRFVRRTIASDGPDDMRGGVKGSFPVDGEYGQWQYLNWACKFTIDANREELALRSGSVG